MNPFHFHRNKKGIWVFGNNKFTDAVGGFFAVTGAVIQVFWREILLTVFLVIIVLKSLVKR